MTSERPRDALLELNEWLLGDRNRRRCYVVAVAESYTATLTELHQLDQPGQHGSHVAPSIEEALLGALSKMKTPEQMAPYAALHRTLSGIFEADDD